MPAGGGHPHRRQVRLGGDRGGGLGELRLGGRFGVAGVGECLFEVEALLAEGAQLVAEAAQAEAADLVRASGGDLVLSETAKRDKAHSALFVGTGKAEELAEAVQQHEIELVVFNHELTPTQERNLEKALQCRVLDRVGLILAIFAQRAQSQEGKLQVELAQLSHLSGRLVRGYGHLQSQKGGIGLKGPGETQLETDRRLISQKISALKKQLQSVHKQRATRRKARMAGNMPTFALVGYTNTGKSSLFNRLTKADVLAKDQLFATLDTTSRKLWLGDAGNIVISDTVGFIRDLPHGLVAAFQATLQEAVDADLLLHVVDAANPHYPEQIQQVQKVLREIGADEIPQILVFNKLDAVVPEARPGVLKDSYDLEGRQVVRLFLSARNAQGLEALRTQLAERVLEARLTTMSPELDAPLQDTPDDWAQSPGQP